jgi:hypothetical protein
MTELYHWHTPFVIVFFAVALAFAVRQARRG